MTTGELNVNRGAWKDTLMPPDVAEPNRTKRPTHTKLYERTMGALIWLAFAVLGCVVLYVLSVLND